MLATRAADASCSLVYVNLVGGQDELVFDGASLVLDAHGDVVGPGARSSSSDIWSSTSTSSPSSASACSTPGAGRWPPPLPGDHRHRRAAVRPIRSLRGRNRAPSPSTPTREIYEALVLGTRDYVTKNGFTDVVIGLSGGVDSSLVATIAVDALGAGPRPRRDDAVALLERALPHRRHGAGRQPRHRVPGHRHRGRPPAYLDMLAPSFAGLPADLAEENIQARIRGTILMALSNKFGWMVLTTGNKSEMAVGLLPPSTATWPAASP